MMRHTFTLRQDHFQELKKHLIKEDRRERVAYIICGRSLVHSDPWEGFVEERFLSKEVFLVPGEELITSTKTRVTWKTESFIRVLKKADENNFAVAVVHNHPEEMAEFSGLDNKNEPELFSLAFNRNGGERPHTSLIMMPSGQLYGRAWDSKLNTKEINRIRILGERFDFLYPGRGEGLSEEVFHRQELAFGKAFNQDFSSLRAAVVGCGGTGSAVAMLLARLGVGYILLIDNDTVEKTNLNRLHCASVSDAEARLPKVDVIAAAIENIGLATKVKPVKNWVESEECLSSLKACDIVFGCTDDHLGRTYLNRLAYFYLIPVIDMGLSIEVSKTEPPEMRVLDGRVTVLYPQNICMLCRKIIDKEQAYGESLRRNNSSGYEELKKEAYVIGEGDPNPAVVTFTTEVATMAVNEFIHRMQGFRGPNGSASERRRFFIYSEDRKTGAKSSPDCEICNSNKYWGHGDMIPLLNLV